MKVSFFYFVFFIALLLSEVSFLDILFPTLSVPLIILLAITSWALLVPFENVFWRTIPLAFLFDIITSSGGNMTLYSLIIVYLVGFLMRRFTADHRGSFIFFLILFSFISVLGFSLFSSFMLYGQGLFLENGRESIFSASSSQQIFLTLLLCIPLSLILLFLVDRFERYMRFTSDTASGKIR